MTSQQKKALKAAKQLERQGKRAEAAQLYQRILTTYPKNAEARRALQKLQNANADPAAKLRALYQQGQFKLLVKTAEAFLPQVRNTPGVNALLGAAHMQLNAPGAAETAFRQVVMAAPDKPAGHNNLGLALRAQGRHADAEKAFKAALGLNPAYAEAWNSLGTLRQETGDATGALEAFEKAANLRDDSPDVWTNLGNMHQQMGDLDAAVEAYRKALQIAPHFAGAHFNLGLAMKAVGQLDTAASHYEKAIAANPNFTGAYTNLGNVLQSLGQLPQAETALRKAVKLSPKDANAQNSLGTVLQKIGRMDEAVAAYDAALNSNPDHAMAAAQRLHQMAHMCDFRAYEDFAKITENLGIKGDEIPPLTLLAMEDSAARQCARARRYAEATFPKSAPAPTPPKDTKRREKLRIGYFSADYRNHPVARLIAGTLAAHDRSRFALYAYSFGPNTEDELRGELSGQFTQFRDIRAMSDAQAADLIAKDKLDIAVDLTSYTQHSRTGLFAKRLAPVQMNYLGYPGTSGAEFMDYIVVDPTLVPPDHRAHVAEALLTLPHCYQPNDNRRDVPKDTKTRTDHGLPEDALVLCCFNSSYKITPREFAIWMRVMAKIDTSVLWLLESNDWARDNLRAQAQKAGIAQDRLIFAPRASNADHLARHQHADIFIDTFAYNAHTTGSDALWMGLPIVTLAGEQFAARVCASLLTAVNLPELITESEAAYEALILALARDPARRTALRQHLETKRNSAPLFDTEGYTRDLEAGFDAAHARWRDGRPPADILIKARS